MEHKNSQMAISQPSDPNPGCVQVHPVTQQILARHILNDSAVCSLWGYVISFRTELSLYASMESDTISGVKISLRDLSTSIALSLFLSLIDMLGKRTVVMLFVTVVFRC